jgi:hypothetical protein
MLMAVIHNEYREIGYQEIGGTKTVAFRWPFDTNGYKKFVFTTRGVHKDERKLNLIRSFFEISRDNIFEAFHVGQRICHVSFLCNQMTEAFCDVSISFLFLDSSIYFLLLLVANFSPRIFGRIEIS